MELRVAYEDRDIEHSYAYSILRRYVAKLDLKKVELHVQRTARGTKATQGIIIENLTPGGLRLTLQDGNTGRVRQYLCALRAEDARWTPRRLRDELAHLVKYGHTTAETAAQGAAAREAGVARKREYIRRKEALHLESKVARIAAEIKNGRARVPMSFRRTNVITADQVRYVFAEEAALQRLAAGLKLIRRKKEN
jgi:hypothetical protein